MSRRCLVPALVVVSLALCGGCSDSREPAGPALKVDQTSAVGELLQIPDSPLSGVSHLSVAAGGQHVALYGGYQLGEQGTPEAFSDRVMVFSLEDRRWDELKLPRPLAFPAAVWVGDELLVAGADCDEPLPEEDSEAFCHDAPVLAQKYDAESAKWEDVSDRPQLSDAAIGLPTRTKAVGVTAEGAVFSFGGREREYHSYSSSSGEWNRVASPPSDTSSLCVVDESLYATGAPDLLGGGDDTGPPEIRIYALEPGGKEWTLTATGDPATEDQMGNKIICGANELAVVPIQPLPETELPGALWFTGSGTLEQVPPLPVTFPGATIGELGAAHLLFPSNPVGGAYSFSNGNWADTGLDVRTGLAFETDSGLLLVAPAEAHEPEMSLLRPAD